MHFNKKIITSIFFALLVFIGTISNVTAKDEIIVPYMISNYKTEINVRENGTAQIKEIIDVSNCEELVLRKRIPTEYKLKTQDTMATMEQSYAISNLKVENHDVSIVEDSGITMLQITLPKKTDSITLTYEVSMKDFQQLEQQLFYYTLFAGFEGSILAYQADITFPKELDFSQIQILNEEDRLLSDYDVSHEGNKLVIKSTKSIIFGSRLSVKTALPPNYFSYGSPIDYQLLVTILSIVFVSGLFIIYNSKEKGNKKKRYLSHPPKEVPMVLYGFIVDGYLNEKDFFPYLVEWANQGFIWIEETTSDIKLILREELPAHATDYEKLFFDALFGTKTVVSLYDLENKDFSLVFEELKEIVYDTLCNNPNISIYHMNQRFYQILTCILAGIPIFLSFLVTYYTENYSLVSSIIPALLGGGMFSISCIPWTILVKKYPILSEEVRQKIICCIGVIQSLLLFIIGYVLLQHHMNFLYIILNILMTIFFMLIVFIFDRRTKTGSKMYKQVHALENFIRQARVAQIDEMLCHEPTYFYNILPCVVALDLVAVWAGKFTAVMIQKPFWFLTPHTPAKSMYWIEPMVYVLEDLDRAILKVPTTPKNY